MIEKLHHPVFRDYSLAIDSWLNRITTLPRLERIQANINKITRHGQTISGSHNMEIHIDNNEMNYNGSIIKKFKKGQKIELIGTNNNDESYMISNVVGNVVIVDKKYRSLKAEQKEEKGIAKQKINVVYGNMQKSVAQIAQPLRNGQHDIPGISFNISDFQYKIEKSRPFENYYIKRSKDNNGDIKVNKVPPLQEYNVHYVINIWAAYQQELDILVYQILSQFDPELYFWIAGGKYDKEYSKGRELQGQWAHCLMDVSQDVSELEPGPSAFRVLRFEIGFMVTNAYLPLGYDTNQNYIGSVKTEFTDNKKIKEEIKI